MAKRKSKGSKSTQFKTQEEYKDMENKEDNTVEVQEDNTVEVTLTPAEDAVLDTEALIIQDFKDGTINMRYLANKYDVTISEVNELVKDLNK